MLIQFSLKNFLSFKEEAVLNMVAINSYKEHQSHLMDFGDDEKCLKVATIYGANASGKSNLCDGFHVFKMLVMESSNNTLDDKLKAIARYYDPFSFTEDKGNTEFEIILADGDFEYKYGFEYNNKKIVNEWLYRKSLNTKRTVTIYERGEDSGTYFGPTVRKKCASYSAQIPKEALLLSFFNSLNLNVGVFSFVYNEILGSFSIDTDILEIGEFRKEVLSHTIDSEKEKLEKFLEAIDTGIKGIGYNEIDGVNSFFTIHKGDNGVDYKLPLSHESEGTLKAIEIYIVARLVIRNNSILFIDELNVKLHPLLLKFVVDLFYKGDSRAQLIYTTHDTTLMDRRFFRRDQIWFVQKDPMGCSELIALSDYKVRSDASFEKDYLSGVYGGIPMLKDFSIKEDL